MSKTRKFDRDMYDDDWNSFDDRRMQNEKKDKRFERALKTKNVDQLEQWDDDKEDFFWDNYNK